MPSHLTLAINNKTPEGVTNHMVQDKESDLIISTLDSILGKNRQCFQNTAPFGVTRNHV
jgi:hypothetical protein